MKKKRKKNPLKIIIEKRNSLNHNLYITKTLDEEKIKKNNHVLNEIFNWIAILVYLAHLEEKAEVKFNSSFSFLNYDKRSGCNKYLIIQSIHLKCFQTKQGSEKNSIATANWSR